MAQRLVRTLCKHCKEPCEIDPVDWTSFTQGAEIELTTPCKPVGCIECRQTGFLGRVGLYEMLEISSEIKKVVTPQSDLQSLRQRAREDGLFTLRLSGAKKVAAGLTTMSEVLRVTPFVD